MKILQKLALTLVFIATGTNFIEAKKSWLSRTWKKTADSANKTFSKDNVNYASKDMWEDGFDPNKNGVGAFAEDSGFNATFDPNRNGFFDEATWDPHQNAFSGSTKWFEQGWNEAFGCPVGMEDNGHGVCRQKCKAGQHHSKTGGDVCHKDHAATIKNLLAHPVPIIFYTAQGGTVIPGPASILYGKSLELPVDTTYIIIGPNLADTNSTGNAAANVKDMEAGYNITVDVQGNLVITA